MMTSWKPTDDKAALQAWGAHMVAVVLVVGLAGLAPAEDRLIRVGVIGLDTSHAVAFTKLLNDTAADAHVPGCRVVAASPRGSRDIPSSTSRVPEYTKAMQAADVEIVDSLDALLTKVDAVLLESNDGRVHLEQAAPVLATGKPLFIDKPLAASLADAIAILRLAEHHAAPVFSASSLRYGEATQAVRKGSVGEVIGGSTYSPCSLEPTHMDLAWYGIHGCEALYTIMGTGCERVTRAHSDGLDLVTGVWNGGRIGTFRGIRRGKTGYGGMAFGSTGIAPAGGFDGYRPLVVEIVRFFQTGRSPVTAAETIELFAFMEAADESRRRDGAPVTLAEVMEKAEAQAAEKVAAMINSR